MFLAIASVPMLMIVPGIALIPQNVLSSAFVTNLVNSSIVQSGSGTLMLLSSAKDLLTQTPQGIVYDGIPAWNP